MEMHFPPPICDHEHEECVLPFDTDVFPLQPHNQFMLHFDSITSISSAFRLFCFLELPSFFFITLN